MFCPRCGKPVEGRDDFCEHCGAALDESAAAASTPAASSENVLLTFGPFGVSICDGPYSMFKWQRKNASYVELTNRRLCVFPNNIPGFMKLPAVLPSSRSSFQIPYDEIVSFEVYPHPAGLGLMQVLDIRYNEGGIAREKSIASYSDRITDAAQIISSARSRLAVPTSRAS